MGLRTRDFHFHLPEHLIASQPLADRAASRMMVVNRQLGTISHHHFREIPQWIQPNDLLVLNNTRVIPARVFSDDHSIELLCLDRLDPLRWRCLVRPGKKMRPGRTLHVGGTLGTVTEVFDNGDRLITWQSPLDLNLHGQLALPHYMGRSQSDADRERYQTVFAREEGAIAAPTAGLHFTPELLTSLPHDFLTLHVGVGTFRPVQVDDPRDHVMHSERYAISSDTVGRINNAHRILAVGTTVTRVLEHLGRTKPSPGLRIAPGSHQGETSIFLYPPCPFHVVGALLTNFHLPESTLIMLVSAFAGRELVLEAYHQAVREEYRFYSYGDCMLLI